MRTLTRIGRIHLEIFMDGMDGLIKLHQTRKYSYRNRLNAHVGKDNWGFENVHGAMGIG